MLGATLAKTLGCRVVSQAVLLERLGLLGPPDPESGSREVDEETAGDAVTKALFRGDDDDFVFEGHLTGLVPLDRWALVVVLRAHPAALRERLRERGYSPEKVDENVQAEVLGVVAGEVAEQVESLRRRGGTARVPLVLELDATDADPDELARAVREVLVAGEVPPAVRLGTVNWLDSLFREGTLYDFLPLEPFPPGGDGGGEGEDSNG